MKATGIVRKIDDLGRIVIPIELRRTLKIDVKEELEIFVNNDSIILVPYKSACIICGEQENLVEYMGKKVCRKCIEALL